MKNLYWNAGEPLETFFTRLDSLGGWPLGRQYCIVQHCCESQRPCYFSNRRLHDEWNSTLCSSDEYYWWKISDTFQLYIKRIAVDEFKQKIAKVFV